MRNRCRDGEAKILRESSIQREEGVCLGRDSTGRTPKGAAQPSRPGGATRAREMESKPDQRRLSSNRFQVRYPGDTVCISFVPLRSATPASQGMTLTGHPFKRTKPSTVGFPAANQM